MSPGLRTPSRMAQPVPPPLLCIHSTEEVSVRQRPGRISACKQKEPGR